MALRRTFGSTLAIIGAVAAVVLATTVRANEPDGSRLAYKGTIEENAATPAASHCADATALGVERTIEVDGSAGGTYGSFSKLRQAARLTGQKEVILTFDDGPMPWITRSILDTLDQYCTKATFFSVGRMALAYPDVVKEVLARGHTLGTHTFSHPFNMPRMNADRAHGEIERGFAAVTAAAGQPIAPFFRFPGLADSSALTAFLGSRSVASFTVDVVSNDSYIHDRQRLIERTLREIEKSDGGIVLFHDIKATTAKALPDILAGLAKRGFKIVHMTAKEPMRPDPALLVEFNDRLSKGGPAIASNKKMPFYGRTGPVKSGDAADTDATSETVSVQHDDTGGKAHRNARRGHRDGSRKSSAKSDPAETATAANDPVNAFGTWLFGGQ